MLGRSPYDPETLAEIDARGRRGAPCADLIPWMMPLSDNQMIGNKDSAIMVCYQFSGPDSDGLSNDDAAGMMRQLQTSMGTLASQPISIWNIVHRRKTDYYATSPMPEPVSQMVDDERRKTFNESGNYVNRHYACLTLEPEIGLSRFAARLMHGINHEGMSIPVSLYHATRAIFSDQYFYAYTASELPRIIEQFERDLSGFVSANPRLTFKRLTGKALGAFLHNCCSPASDYVESLDLPDSPALDVDLCDTNIEPGADYLYFYSNGRFRMGVAAGIPSARDFWPNMATTQSLDTLLKIPGELTICHCYRLATRNAAQRFIHSIRKFHENKQVDLRAVLASAMRNTNPLAGRQNKARAEAAEEANRKAGRVEMSQETYGHYNLSVIAYSPAYQTPYSNYDRVLLEQRAYDEAVELHKKVEAALRKGNFVPVRETLHALSAFATTLPGMWRECVRWVFFNTEVLSRFLPLRGVSAGKIVNAHLTKETGRNCTALAPLITEYGTPFWFTAFVQDVGHMLICGRTGYGKTIFMLLCATLFRKYPFVQIFGFDKNLSMRIPTLLQGGRYMRVGEQASSLESTHMNPISLLADKRHWPFIVHWIQMLVRQRSNYEMTDADREDLEGVLAAQSKRPRKFWRLGSVQLSLAAGPFARALAAWTHNAFDAHWFDHVDDAFEDHSIEGGWISMATDKVLSDPAIARAFISYVTYRIQATIEDRRAAGIIGPTIVLVPEIWNLLDDAAFAKQIGDWIVTMRKLLGCVWMDAQSPEQVSDSAIWPAIRDNVLVRVMVPVENFTPDTESAYVNKFGLSKRSIKVISELTPKKDYLITEVGGVTRRVSVALKPHSVAILRSEQSAQILFERHLASGDENWRMNYITEAVADIEASQRVDTNQEEVRHAA